VIGGISVAYRGELFKLLAQRRTWLGFATVAGDVVAREREEGTLKTVLTRSLTRNELVLGKMLALFTYLVMAMAAFFIVSTVAGVIAWGFNPLVNLSGQRISALHALALDVPAIIVYTLPVLAIASFGLFL
jgi:ABC-2 type transport system permease protein